MTNNHFNEITDEFGSIYINNKLPKSVCCYNKEIIKVNHRIVHYPHDTIPIITSDISLQKNQPEIHLDYIMPPIIVNLRKDATPHHATTRKQLSHMEIDYFKQNGNNALIFIHGFNIKLGQFSNQVEKLNIITDSITTDSTPQVTPITSSSQRTLYRNATMIKKRFNEIKQHNCGLDSKLNLDSWLNGSGAHNWFVHMEDNLNRATQQFDRTNYCSFTRMINVAWSGDVSPLKFISAEAPAEQAGKTLVALILQLHRQGIEINIIAHSLGCRLLLSLMHELGRNNKDNILNQVILWQAATPANALSNKGRFCHAYRSSRRITVLYSQHDWVLWIAYTVINKLGAEPSSNKNKWKIRHQYLKSRKQMEWQPLLNEVEHIFSTGSALQLLDSGNDASQSSFEVEKLRMMVMDVKQRISRQHKIAQALGYVGPDRYTRKLLKHKLIAVEQTELKGHSAMKNPSQQLMQSIYQQYIIGGRHGIRRFGPYRLKH